MTNGGDARKGTRWWHWAITAALFLVLAGMAEDCSGGDRSYPAWWDPEVDDFDR